MLHWATFHDGRQTAKKKDNEKSFKVDNALGNNDKTYCDFAVFVSNFEAAEKT